MAFKTDCVTNVGSYLSQQIGGHMLTLKLTRAYYKLTGHIPRPMPETKEDLEKIKDVFKTYFDIKDDPQVWYTIFSNIGAIKADKVRFSYQSLANIAKRLDTNKLLQDQKQIEYQTHMDKLELGKTHEDAPKEPTSDEPGSLEMREGALDLKGEVPSVSEPQSRMVQLP